jgi:hypothetical protein
VAGSTPARLGGRTALPNGDIVVWSVADGRRGRRWRESGIRGGVVVRTILVETATTGGVRRLEVATAAGLLTLHPDASGDTLHGNVVSPRGIRHLRFSWGLDRTIMVEGSPAMTAIALAGLGHEIVPGQKHRADVLRIDDLLIPAVGQLEITRLEERIWRSSDPGTSGSEITITLDADDLLVSPDRTTWPLEG